MDRLCGFESLIARASSNFPFPTSRFRQYQCGMWERSCSATAIHKTRRTSVRNHNGQVNGWKDEARSGRRGTDSVRRLPQGARKHNFPIRSDIITLLHIYICYISEGTRGGSREHEIYGISYPGESDMKGVIRCAQLLQQR